MKKFSATLTSTVLGLALATSAVAQERQENFPKERTQVRTCANVDWNEDMLLQHPGLIGACQEIVVVDGTTWARFAAKFVKVRPTGNVVFSVRDKRDRELEQVVLVPFSGQVAYIEDRPTPFSELLTTDKISLYVPEGQYGFATQPGVPPEQVSTLIVPAPVEPVAETAPVVASADPAPRLLPATASSLPWIALTGILFLLGGMVMTLRRRS